MIGHDDFLLAELVDGGSISREDVSSVRGEGGRAAQAIDALVALGRLKSRDVALVRAQVCEFPFVDLDRYEVDLSNAAMLPRSVAEGVRAFVLFSFDSVATVAMADPMDLAGVDRLRAAVKRDVQPVVVDPAELSQLIARAYSIGAVGAGTADKGAGDAAEAELEREPIVAAVNAIIAQAITEGASDVHINPDDTRLLLRYRIDGVLQERQGPGLASHPAMVQRLKVMARLDVAQSRRPQDGKFRFRSGRATADVRVSVVPTVSGENVVLRLLSDRAGVRSLEELGFDARTRGDFEMMLTRPHGMILVTGPTGSGKSTTLYGALRKLSSPQRNVVTIEDPVELRMPLVRQVQVNSEIGLTFASALRSILRQDPDVILVGEIRDEETARIAVQSALTGHLVLATLHTNDAPGAIPRLADMQAPAFAVSAALVGVLAQRLVRRVCAECSADDSPDPLLLSQFNLGATDGQFRRGRGCPKCGATGYRGRLGVYELMTMSASLRAACAAHASGDEIRRVALREGMRALWRDGVEKALLGSTTLDEVSRVSIGDEAGMNVRLSA